MFVRRFQDRPTLADINRRRNWRDGDSLSGSGSDVHATSAIRAGLEKVLDAYGVTSMLDAPCGDLSWMPLVDGIEKVRYVGADISPTLVAANKRKFAQENVRSNEPKNTSCSQESRPKRGQRLVSALGGEGGGGVVRGVVVWALGCFHSLPPILVPNGPFRSFVANMQIQDDAMCRNGAGTMMTTRTPRVAQSHALGKVVRS